MEIIDVSVIIKWFVDEADEDTMKARELRDAYLIGDRHFLIPDFLYIELANICSFKQRLTPSEINYIWKQLDTYDIPSIATDRKLLRKAIDVSKHYGISVYDAIYVVMAIERNTRLITSDKKLVRSVSEDFVQLL